MAVEIMKRKPDFGVHAVRGILQSARVRAWEWVNPRLLSVGSGDRTVGGEREL